MASSLAGILACLCLLVSAAVGQEEDLRRVIERLRSESSSDRDQAFEQLLSGWLRWRDEDLALLKQESRGTDPETAARAAEALARIGVRRKLGRPLATALGKMDRLLLNGTAEGRLAVLSEAGRLWRRWEVGADDLQKLAELAEKEGWNLASGPVLDLINRRDLSPYSRLLVAALKDAEPVNREKARSLLGKLRCASTAGRVAELLQAPNPTQRLLAIATLAEIGSAPSAALIRPFLVDPSPGFRESAAYALGRLGSLEDAAAICRLLDDKVPQVRSAAVQSLADMKADSCRDRILALLEDGDAPVRASALRALVRLDPKEGAARASRLLEDSDPLVQEGAIRALGHTKNPAWASTIVPHLASEQEGLRMAAAIAVAEVDARDQADRLIALLADPESPVSGIASTMLRRMGGREVARGLRSRLQSVRDENSISAIVDLLSGLDPAEATAPLVALLKGPREDARRAAAGALCRLGAGGAAAEILRAMEFGDVEAVLQLGTLAAVLPPGEPRDQAMRKLEALEKHEDADLRAAASVGLLRLGKKDRAAQLGLLKEIASRELLLGGTRSDPTGKMIGIQADPVFPDLLESLWQIHDPEGFRAWHRFGDLGRSVSTAAELEAELKERGLQVELPQGLEFWGRLSKGSSCTAAQLLERLTTGSRGWVTVWAGGKVTIRRLYDAFDGWHDFLRKP